MTRMSNNHFKGLLATVAGGLLALSVGGTASAAGLGPNFNIDQSCGTPGPTSPCSEAGGTLTNIDSINFSYQALVDQANSGGVLTNQPFTEKGFMTWSAYQNDSHASIAGSALNFDYQVYATFTATGTATFNGTGIDASFSTFTINFFMDDNANTLLSLPGVFGDPVISGNGEDALLASASLLGPSQARLFAGLANGDFEVILTDLGLSLLGQSFFTTPNPFYKILDFTGVTTDIQGASITDPFVAQLTGSGDMFFVPEPASLGLIGIGLLSMGGMLYRRRRAVAI